MIKIPNNQRGFAAFFVTMLIFSVVFAISTGVFILTYGEQKIMGDIVKSSRAYYAAESGVEDALLRLKNSPQQVGFISNLNLGTGLVTTTVSNIIGGARVIIAEGNTLERIRKISVIYRVSTQEASFYYGAQVGDGGITMNPGSKINGNVFSNGSATGAGTITNTAVVAGNGNKIEGLSIGENARVFSCKDSAIGGRLTYVSGGSIEKCTAAEFVDGGPDEIQPRDFPISSTTIDNWKNEAESGGTIIGDLTISSDTSLGPVKINGNLLIKNAKVIITGTVWVTGTFDTGNNVEVRLDEISYGDLSGVLIADGNVQIRNNAILEGTSSPSSYFLIISDSSSLSESPAAINVKNNALGSVLFAPNGLMVISNNVELIEATAYKILLENNAEITYEIGLENLEFTSGPAGSWEVTSWGEVE